MNTETQGPGAAPANPFGERREQTFPTLTPAQIARLIPHGRRIAVHKGQILAEPGDRHRDLFVVLSGSIEIVRLTMQGRSNSSSSPSRVVLPAR